MAATHPPYHLRTNKAVDRLLFLEQIQKTLVPGQPHGTYHSLGGPFMEDLRLVHRRFPRMKLICIESDSQTRKRQQAHKFTRQLETRHRTFSDFIAHDYEPKNYDIFWLDFTDFSAARLTDFQEALRVIRTGSLIRLTVRCEAPINERLVREYLEEDKVNELKASAYAEMKKEFERLVPPTWAAADPVNSNEHARFVQGVIRMAVSDALDKAADREFLHLTSTYYDDGTRMLSVTGLVCLRPDLKSESLRLKVCGLEVDAKWERPPEFINLPHLSVQERARLDVHLPIGKAATGKTLQRKLGYWVEGSEKSSQEALRQYANYYQEYPSFLRLAY